MTGKLTDHHMDQLESWIDTGPKIFTLLYSITRDGCASTTFHQKCDNRGPTVTILYNQQGSVYGGYTCASWNNCSNYEWIRDDKAFLYQLTFSGNKTTNKFPCTKNPEHAIQARSSYGPTFGCGYDLHTFNGTVSSSDGYFALNGYMDRRFGNSYDTQGVTADNVNNGNMNVTELEVYIVIDGTRQKPQTLPTKPWRKTSELNQKYLAKLMEELENFKPMSDLDISEYRILMLGPVGSGKSSFYNTIDSIFRGRISHRAVCGNGEQSTTTVYTPYGLRTKTGSTLKFSLCDTRGLEEAQGPDILECNFLIDGHVPDFYQFNSASAITLHRPDFCSTPTLSDRVHSVVFVLDASTLEDIPAKVIEKINSFRKIMNHRQLPQAVLLTGIDKVSDTVLENTSNVFKCKKVEKAVGKAAALLGLPLNSVFPVKNYHSEVHLDDSVSIPALMALQQLLYLADDYTETLAAMMKRGPKLSPTRGACTQEVTESDTA